MNNVPTEIDCFNEVYETIAGLIGIDSMLKIYEVFKGQQVNYPVKLFNKTYAIKTVIKLYDGHNLNRLATKYGYSERHLRYLMKEYIEADDKHNKEV